MLVESTDVDKTGKRENPTLDLTLVDPLDPAKSRKLATLPGTGWGDFSFSFDDKRLAMLEFISVNESYVWVMDLATGAKRRVLPAEGEKPAQPDLLVGPQFRPRRQGLFLATDRDGEFRKLAYLDLATGKVDYFGDGGNWDVEEIALSPDGTQPRRHHQRGRRRRAAPLRRRRRAARCRSRRCRSAACAGSSGTRIRATSR